MTLVVTRSFSRVTSILWGSSVFFLCWGVKLWLWCLTHSKDSHMWHTRASSQRTVYSYVQRDSFVYCSKSAFCASNPIFKEHYLCVVHQIPYSKSTTCASNTRVLCSKSTTCASNPIFTEHYVCIKSHIQRALFEHQIPYSNSTICASNPMFKEHCLCIKSHIQRALFVHQIPYSQSTTCASNPIFKVHQIPYSNSTICASNPIFTEHYLCIKSHIQRALFVHQIPYSKSTICASNPIFKKHFLCIKHKGSLSVRTSNTGVVTLIFNSLGFGVW